MTAFLRPSYAPRYRSKLLVAITLAVATVLPLALFGLVLFLGAARAGGPTIPRARQSAALSAPVVSKRSIVDGESQRSCTAWRTSENAPASFSVSTST